MRLHKNPMFAVAIIGYGCMIAVAAAAVTYTPQAWRLYRSGVLQSGNYVSSAACDAALRALPVNTGQVITFRCQQSTVARGIADPLPPVPTVGSALLSWTAPTTRLDGSQLTNLAGYRVRYWLDEANPFFLMVANPLVTQVTIERLDFGLWHFALSAYDTTGTESVYTMPVTKDVR